MLRYVEPLSAARTPLADFFSILLNHHSPEGVVRGARRQTGGLGTACSYRRARANGLSLIGIDPYHAGRITNGTRNRFLNLFTKGAVLILGCARRH